MLSKAALPARGNGQVALLSFVINITAIAAFGRGVYGRVSLNDAFQSRDKKTFRPLKVCLEISYFLSIISVVWAILLLTNKSGGEYHEKDCSDSRVYA